MSYGSRQPQPQQPQSQTQQPRQQQQPQSQQASRSHSQREQLFIRAPPQLELHRCHPRLGDEIFIRAPAPLHADADAAKAVLSQDGLALARASMTQRGDHDLVLTAVQQDGLGLQFATAKLRASPEIVTAAVAQNPRAWRYAADEVRLSKAFLEVAVEESEKLLFGGRQLSPQKSEVSDRSVVFILEAGGKQVRARGKMSEAEVHRLPLLEAIVDSADRGFHSPETDENDAVIVQIPVCVSPEEMRAFFAGRRASLSDFVLADFFLDPALRHLAIAYLKECRGSSFQGCFHNFLTSYPPLVRLLCQFGPELGLSNKDLLKLFCQHCWERIPVKSQKKFECTVAQIASGVSWHCTCCACQEVPLPLRILYD